MIYIVTAGNASTGLGIVGKSNSVQRAKTLGRKAVNEMLGGMGSYTVIKNSNREPIVREEKSLRTGGKWVGRL